MTRERYERANLRPEVVQLLAAAAAAKGPEPTPIETMRATDMVAAAYFNAGAPEIALEREIRIDTGAASLRALVYAPVREPRGLPVILHLHGGGFVFMLPESYGKAWKEIAIGAGAIVVSLDYRLAPERPYPVPLDDTVAVFRWLREHAAELGGDPTRLAMGGESAGGGLAASATLRLLKEGDAPPTAVSLACAWLDLRDASPSFRAFGPDDALIDTATMAYWRGSYAPKEEPWSDPMLSPVLGDLSGFPPACVVVGGIDPLYDDGVTFADRLTGAGGNVELHDYEGMPHIFWNFPPLAELTDATARIAEFFRRHLHA